VQLDAHIRLLDSPGVVLASECQGGGTDPAELALKNALKVETLADPIAPVQALLKRCSVKVLMLHYSIPQFASTDEFLSLVARKMGRLKKGGVPNQTAAARSVLNDWNKGKLR
jgi:nuclear GTP-binding protein